MKSSVSALLTAGIAVATTSLASGGISVQKTNRTIDATVNGLSSSDSESLEEKTLQAGPWESHFYASTPTQHTGATAAAGQESQVLSNVSSISQVELFSGRGGSSAFTDDWLQDSTLSAAGASRAAITFKSDQAFAWSLDYLMSATAGGTKSGYAISHVTLTNISTNTVVAQAGGEVKTSNQMPAMNWNGSLNGTLPAGEYRLYVVADAGVNWPNAPGNAGQTGSNSQWDASFSVRVIPQFQLRRYYEIQPPYDPWIVFEDVLVNLGRDEFPARADSNSDDVVDVNDVIEVLGSINTRSSSSAAREQSPSSRRTSSSANQSVPAARTQQPSRRR